MKILLIFLMSSCQKISNHYGNDSNEAILRSLNDLNAKDEEAIKDKVKRLRDLKKLTNYSDDKCSNLLMLIIKSELPLEDKKHLFFYTIQGILKENIDKFTNKKEISTSDVESIIKQGKGEFFEYIKVLFELRDVRGRSLIFYVFDQHEEYFINLLIDVCSLETMDSNSLTPLVFLIVERANVFMYLCDKGYINRFNLNYNYKIKAKIKDPLIYAVVKGDKELLKQMLKIGCSPDSIDEKGNKAILVAAHKGDYDIVDILLASGASYLTRTEIISKKLDYNLRNIAAVTMQLTANIGTKIAGSPISPNLSSLYSYALDSKDKMTRIGLYTRIYQRFLEGFWLELGNDLDKNITRYKDFLSGVDSYISDVPKEEILNKFDELISCFGFVDKAKKKITDLFINGKGFFVKKVLEYKTFVKRLNKLEGAILGISFRYLNDEQKIIWYKIYNKFHKSAGEQKTFKERVELLREKINKIKNEKIIENEESAIDADKNLRLKSIEKREIILKNRQPEIRKLVNEVRNDLSAIEADLQEAYKDFNIINSSL